MSHSVQRIDHAVAVVENFEVARSVWIEAGCPVVYDGTMPTHRACCVSIGSINLELLSAEAFDGWPAQLVELCLGCADPEAIVQSWQGIVGASHLREGDGFVVQLGDTPIRVVPGEGLTVVVESRGDGPAVAKLAALVPELRLVSLNG
jgi:hypothetical protein